MELPEWGFLEGDAARDFVVDAEDRSTILGAGAYGAVYSATMQGLPVAAKTLHALRESDPGVRQILRDVAASQPGLHDRWRRVLPAPAARG